MFGERDRYPRRTVRDQLEELGDWAREHRLALLIALVAVAVLVWLFTPGQPVRPQDLVVGDCLYLRTPAVEDVGPSARPIGEPAVVAAAVLAGRAVRTGCNEPHGHEVAALVDMPRTGEPRPGHLQGVCEEAFEEYGGRSVDGSALAPVVATPSAEQWDAGVRRAICLIARRDGEWMDHPARDSGE